MNIKNCVNCNKDISQTRKEKYCSKECNYNYNRGSIIEKSKERYRNKERFIFKWRVLRNCEKCDEEYIPNQINQKYCSINCRDEVYGKKYDDISKGIIIKGNGELLNYYRLRFEIFKRDNFTCQYCGRNVKEDKVKLHLDHIHPRKREGKNNDNNLVTSCQECNLGKSDVLLKDKKLNSLKTKNVKN